MATILFYAQFTAAKVGATGLTVDFRYDRITRSDGTLTTVTGLSASEGSKGVYRYRLTSADLNLYDYIGTFVTADASVDQQEIPALWTRFSEAVTTDSSGKVLALDGNGNPIAPAATALTAAQVNAEVDTALADVGLTITVTGRIDGPISGVATMLASAHGSGSWATATGFSTLDPAGVRTAVGLAAANLDDQLDEIAAAVAEGGGGGGGGGGGSVVIDHDYGGANNLAAVDGLGHGIDGVTVRAYLASEWATNPLTAVIRGQTTTVATGAWSTTMNLDPASYSFVYSIAGYVDTTKAQTVT